MNRLVDGLAALVDAAFPGAGILSFHAPVAGGVPSPEMHVSATTLEAQLRFVRDSYQVVPLREIVARVQSGRTVRRLVAITFDDAYAGVAHHALPILRALGLPATIFVTVAQSETGGSYWWDAVDMARRDAATGSGEGWRELLDGLSLPPLAPTTVSTALIREHVLAAFRGEAPAACERVTIEGDLRALSFGELRALAASHAGIDFGCHTLTHPALPLISAAARAHELRDSLARLERELPRVVPVLAYPFGLYDHATASGARRAGLTAGVTLQGRSIHPTDDPMMLPRIGVSETRTIRSLALRLNSGLRPLMIARTGSLHPPMPRDPFANRARDRGTRPLETTSA